MNQKVVIYIILSAILLYLYYKRGGLALFAAFVVVVVGTLFSDAREGMSLGGKGDKECAKFGFTSPKIDKNDITGSLEKVCANIRPIASKYWKRRADDIGEKSYKEKEVDEKFEKIFKEFIDAIGSFFEKNKDKKDKIGSVLEILYPAVNSYIPLLDTKTKTDAKDGIVNEYIISKLDKIIGNTKPALELIDLFKKSDEFKGLDKDAKQLSIYLVCLGKHWISIYKAIQKAKGSGGDGGDGGDGGGGGDGGDAEEEKPKKKKKKATKKKKKSDEDDEDADEE